MKEKKGSVFGATMLVAGTCIGGGMLALPVATGKAGFLPSLLMMVLGWGFMTITALFLAEVNLWMEKGAHVITMASRLLGPLGKGVAWLLYLFIGYASLVAYTAGGKDLLKAAVSNSLGLPLTDWAAALIFVSLFIAVIYMGNVFVGRVNEILMIGLVLSYIFLISVGTSCVNWHFLLRRQWEGTWVAVPLLLTIFSFQTIVPSLTIYLQQDGKALRRSIIYGTTLSLAVYAIWQVLVLGTVPFEGECGLAQALTLGQPATDFFKKAVNNPLVSTTAAFFAFFALVTSFLGIAMGLFDFLADGLKIKRAKWGNVSLAFLVAIPILFFVFTMERAFLQALDSSGGIGDAILNGLMPGLMLWRGRYQKGMVSEHRTFGGKPLIALILIYSTFVFTIEILGKLGIVSSL